MIAEFAAAQHGVVARRQLIAAGVVAHAVDYRLEIGRLTAVHRGVYRAGPAPARWEREMAAILACGDTAVLSHRSAAALWGLAPGGPRTGGSRGRIEVTVTRGQPAPGRGVVVHRVGSLGQTETTTAHGIPITTGARTLFDLAAVLGERALEQALAEAERRGIARIRQLERLAARYPGRKGVRQVRQLIHRGGAAFTRSEAEERLLALVRAESLPEPEVNVVLLGFEVDFYWPDAGLVVEVDGSAYHSDDAAFERDRIRDTRLTLAGFRVLRFTWRRLVEEPRTVMDQLAQGLAGPL